MIRQKQTQPIHSKKRPFQLAIVACGLLAVIGIWLLYREKHPETNLAATLPHARNLTSGNTDDDTNASSQPDRINDPSVALRNRSTIQDSCLPTNSLAQTPALNDLPTETIRSWTEQDMSPDESNRLFSLISDVQDRIHEIEITNTVVLTQTVNLVVLKITGNRADGEKIEEVWQTGVHVILGSHATDYLQSMNNGIMYMILFSNFGRGDTTLAIRRIEQTGALSTDVAFDYRTEDGAHSQFSSTFLDSKIADRWKHLFQTDQ